MPNIERRDAFIALCLPAVLFGAYFAWKLLNANPDDFTRRADWLAYRDTHCQQKTITQPGKPSVYEFTCDGTKHLPTHDTSIPPSDWPINPPGKNSHP